MKRILSAVAQALLAAATAAADDDVRSKPLTLHAPAPAARAMQYALLPELQDMIPGNAACAFIGYVTSDNIAQDRKVRPGFLPRVPTPPPRGAPLRMTDFGWSAARKHSRSRLPVHPL